MNDELSVDGRTFEEVWGHTPFWDDIDSFNKRVEIMEMKYG